jgi:hypothetical protein
MPGEVPGMGDEFDVVVDGDTALERRAFAFLPPNPRLEIQ